MTEIELRSVLPNVFANDEDDALIRRSQVWLKDLKFAKGEYYRVEAESGTGKSSLCSFIFGNRSDYSGKILFDGQNLRKFSIEKWCDIRRRSISLLPQEMRLFPELTVMENIQIKNRLTGFCTENQIASMLEALGIQHKANVLAGKLSVGQQQRVAIIRALCQPFDFLILDEPVSHLDERNNSIAASLILEHAQRQGAAIITTSVGNPLLLPAQTITISL